MVYLASESCFVTRFFLTCLQFEMDAGTIGSITVPALYSKYEEHVDKYFGLIHQKFSKHYKVVDESIIRRIPEGLSKDKNTWIW